MSEFINLNTIIGNGKSYQVPIYQRDYSWTQEDWEDLWYDILEIPNDKTHYLGYLVLQPLQTTKPHAVGDAFWVIDGQQRLTTLSILSLAVTALLKKWSQDGIDERDNIIRAEKITERYLGNYSLSKLSILPKLTLNRNNDNYYKSWLLELRKSPPLKKLKPSQKLLQEAFNYYLKQLESHFKDNQSGASLSEFLEKTVGNGIVFTQIIVTSDLDAFKVFETLNARGVKLSTADLLKNYLFQLTHALSDIDLEKAERMWQNITDTIRANNLTTYIRHFWNSSNKIERQPTLFKAIKRKINSPEQAFGFLNDLESSGYYYTAFNNPTDSLWDKKEERPHFKVLTLLGATTCYSLMIAALNYLPRKEFRILLRELTSITFRYHMSDLNPNEAERVFSRVANKVADKEITTAKEISLALQSIYVSDKRFEQAFSTAKINTRSDKELAKYILVKIENHVAHRDLQPEEASSTIEHILPLNPGDTWDECFDADLQEDYIYRLGNYTLLEADINKKLDNNMPFSEKLEAYQTSEFKLSNEYCRYHTFTPEQLAQRQDKMASIAKGIWQSHFIPSLK